MSKKYTLQIKDTASNISRLCCFEGKIKLYVEDSVLYADFHEGEQHEYISPFKNGDDIYELFFNEYVYPVSQEYQDICDSWIITEAK